jgi:chromosome segregation ATPase
LNVMARINQFSKEEKVDSLHIADNPRFAEAAGKLSRFNQEIASARHEINRINTEWYQEKQKAASTESAIDIADRLLNGSGSAAEGDGPAKLRDLERKVAVLQPGAFKQGEIVNRLRGELSAEAAKIVQDRHRKALVKILEAARALVDAANVERKIRVQLLDLGYEIPESILPSPRLAAGLILGDESFHDSAIATFVRQLQDLGIPS